MKESVVTKGWRVRKVGKQMFFRSDRVVVIALLALAQGGAPALAQDAFIAGTTPSVRPANAPTITEFAKDAAWTQRALHGVDAPYPESLGFLDDQGGWFNPFLHPGMLGPYDIRKWHEPAK